MFFAQVGHECAGFTRFEENLIYTPVGLAKTWPARYARKNEAGRYVKSSDGYLPNDLAQSLHRKPKEIADLTYANRLGNGSVASGDGWRYRGRGPKQVTGKSNYRELTKALWPQLGIDFVVNPGYLLEPAFGLWAAVWFWKINRLNTSADAKDVQRATKVINGGSIGLADRKSRFETCYTEITNTRPV